MTVFDWPSTLFPESPSCQGWSYIRLFKGIFRTSCHLRQDVKYGKNECWKISDCGNILVCAYLIIDCHVSPYGYDYGIAFR